MTQLTHFDSAGESRMVDVSQKPVSHRYARASAVVRMLPATLRTIQDRQVSKGDVCEVARLAGIMAAKRTSELIPLCHVLALESVSVHFNFLPPDKLRIESEVRVEAKTGVEMEALTAVAVAALTVYDMCKSIDRSMVIEAIQLEEKAGGRSGHYRRAELA